MCVCVCERERERETYKLELFLVIPKKKKKGLVNIKSFKIYIFYGLFILDSSFFYTKSTHLVQKLKNLD